MPNEKEIDKRRSEIKETIKGLLTKPVDDWAVRPALGDINFAEALPVIGRVKELLTLLATFNLDYISFNRLNALDTALKQISKLYERLNSFTLSVDNPNGERNAIVSELQNQYDGWFEAISPIVAFAIRSTTDFDALERDLRNKISQAEASSSKMLEEQKALLAESQETLAAIKKASAEAGVSREAIHFATQATEHRDSAFLWMCATVVAACATAAWGAIALWMIPVHPDAKTAEIVQQAIGKLIIFSALYYGLVWSARNFNASRHNYVVNKHRQNSLSTFESFVKAADQDLAIKNAVLLQATTSIFTAQPSGYAAKDSEPDSPNKIIEIMRSFTERPAKPG